MWCGVVGEFELNTLLGEETRLPQILLFLNKKMHKMFDKDASSIQSSGPQSIQEIAVKLAEEQQRLRQLEASSAPKERTLFVLGSKGVGKSTAINKFFDREDHAARPTLALEYSYGRRMGSGKMGSSQVLNVWELGSLDNSEQLLEVPMRSHGLQQLAAFIMLDLSQPQCLWTDLERAYRGLRETAQTMLEEATPQQRETLEQRAQERVKRESGKGDDLYTLELLPFPVVIVGGKYDIFMNLEPALKKHICCCLRSISHLIGGAVLFYSQQLPKLAKVLRDTISHLGFGSPANPFRAHVTDYNDALSIWFGTDNWTRISETGAMSLERIEARLGQSVPQQKAQQQNQLQDPVKDAGFSESIIDEMRAQKNEELNVIMRDVQLRGKFESVQN
ncbi:cytoplasmic dynein 2 light intermediate chain 1 [Scaptodrosophila lebanonensis]|uniref:Cytoplasmic dynein 2 light intermediate chain 1 n=1 Tax=Drosophila lebanonensis TaxID=7225 RepID=A0A6J2T6B8_DROLE|nr:cytoplasmic dynein 2 light intermediate chain 1 [Scaptodrosophila lebanonensis]